MVIFCSRLFPTKKFVWIKLHTLLYPTLLHTLNDFFLVWQRFWIDSGLWQRKSSTFLYPVTFILIPLCLKLTSFKQIFVFYELSTNRILAQFLPSYTTGCSENIGKLLYGIIWSNLKFLWTIVFQVIVT